MARGQASGLPLALDALRELQLLEGALGGREGIVAAMALSPLTKDQQYFLGLMADPANAGRTLLEICRQGDMLPGRVIDMIRGGLHATSRIQAEYLIAKGTPLVVRDVMHKGAPHQDPCEQCQGVGKVTADPTEGNPNPSPTDCTVCGGTGQLVYPADPECRKLALDLSGMLPKAGGISITNQQLAVASGGGGSSAGGDLEYFQEAMDHVLFGGSARATLAAPHTALPTLDVTPTVVDPVAGDA